MNRNHMFREIGRAISESGMTTGRERRLAIPPREVNPPRLTAYGKNTPSALSAQGRSPRKSRVQYVDVNDKFIKDPWGHQAPSTAGASRIGTEHRRDFR